MDDEFALCWNNFQDNIATGFQNLFDRGDLVDVTLACDGKLLQAHKIVLAICSPYFQEMFITNPCKHPIIILKDVTFTVMSELLQFMYQGVVNVKHTDLSSFMKIAQALQIKGLATSAQKSPSSPIQSNNSINLKNNLENSSENFPSNVIETKANSNLFTSKADGLTTATSATTTSTTTKRSIDFSNESLSVYPKKQLLRRTSEGGEHEISAESMENISSDEVFLPPIPQISMVETSRFDLTNVKREATEPLLSPSSIRNIVPPPFNFEYSSNSGYNKGSVEYPNELHNEFSKSGSISGGGNGSSSGNHMEIPAGGSITMLSSTSLLHGNCIFNRNNTVATQQGMKTYWLCKSYRITMCRARCITHQGRVISATGVHNHQPHMKGPPTHGSEFMSSMMQGNNSNGLNPPLRLPSSGNQSPQHIMSQSSPQQHHQQQQQQQQQTHQQTQQQPQQSQQQPPPPPSTQQLHHQQSQQHLHQQQQQQQQQQHQHQQHQQQQHHQSQQSPHQPQTIHHPQTHIHPHHQPTHHQQHPHNSAVIQNMMHNVLNQNNLIQLTNMAPILNPLQHHVGQLSSIHPPSSLQITPISNNMQSPTTSNVSHSPRINSSHHQQQDSPNIHHHSAMITSNANNSNSNMSIVVTSSSLAHHPPPASSSSPHNNDHCGGVPESIVSSQSNIISSVTISPTPQSFKMEHNI